MSVAHLAGIMGVIALLLCASFLAMSPLQAYADYTAGSVNAQASSTVEYKTISEGTVKYKTLDANTYKFVPKKSGIYRFKDRNASVAGLNVAFHQTYSSSSRLNIYDVDNDDEPLYKSYFGYDGTKKSYRSAYDVYLEKGKTYKIWWSSQIAMSGQKKSSFTLGRLWAEEGSRFTVGGVRYEVTDADVPEVEVVKAKNVKRWSGRDSILFKEVEYSVTSVGAKAFAGNKKLVEFQAEYLESVGARAFSGCTKLKRVALNDSIRKIGSSAFSSCKKLKALIIERVPKLAKKNVKGCLKGSSVKYVLMNCLNAQEEKKCKKLFKKVFSKSNSGRAVTIDWVGTDGNW